MLRMTLLELANRTNNGNLIEIAEVLTKKNKILEDAPWVEANNLTGHVHNKRVTLPVGTWRMINQGVSSEKSITKQITEGIGMLEARSEIDKKLVDIAPNKPRFRFSEDKAFIEGLSQSLADVVLYGNKSINPEQIDGLATRYNTLGGTILGAGGTGDDTTSIWAIRWGEDRVFFVYPKGSDSMGLKVRDLGEKTVYDAEGKPFQAYVTLFTWDVGIVIRNDLDIGRLANIETSGTSNLFDPKQLNALLRQMNDSGEDTVLYCNKTIFTQIDNDAMDKSNVQYTSKEVYGKQMTFFKGLPIRQVDAILDTESAIQAA